MPPICQKSNPDLYEYVKDRNLQGQWFLLETLVNHSLKSKNYSFTRESLFALHQAAANLIDQRPGGIRSDHVSIIGSDHKPPHDAYIDKFLDEFFHNLNGDIFYAPVTYAGAYALWRLTWIHPFYECNGRTARAFSYLVMCRRLGRWPGGERTIHQLIRENDRGYYRGLQIADKAYESTGNANLDYLDNYLRRLLFLQLASSKKSP